MTRNRLPLPILIVAVLAIVAVITATSGGTKKGSQQTQAAAAAISLGHTPVGKALVDAHGRTLYLFAADKPNVSRLSAAGQAVWPPFTAATAPAATGGASAAAIGTIPSSRQITYNGHPLYYYVGDHDAGQTAGQGLNEFGARWYVLSAAGAAITSAPKSGTASQAGQSTPAGGGASYGY
jgi:predicted lipoprotein with Yx(FWY)xxD motif